MTHTFVLTGRPIPLARPRLSKGVVYDSQKDKKNAHTLELQIQKPANYIIPTRPLQLVATFFIPLPKSTTKYKRTNLLSKPHVLRPDIDNMCKYLLDVCNGMLIKDDAQVASIHARKIWADQGKTTFQFVEII